MAPQKIPAAQFKSQCLALMEQVAQSGRPVVVTKHGKPMVRITRVEPLDDEIFGFLKEKARIAGDVVSSIPLADWNLAE